MRRNRTFAKVFRALRYTRSADAQASSKIRPFFGRLDVQICSIVGRLDGREPSVGWDWVGILLPGEEAQNTHFGLTRELQAEVVTE